MKWFDVNKEGLAALSARRGAAFILHELLQNSWDSGARSVAVTIEPVSGVPLARLQIEDDCPEGFADLSHAWTLFSDSAKRGDAAKRGRFNLGEKLVLACCRDAEIVSTKGGVRFDDEGRHQLRRRREAGSHFSATIRLTREQIFELDEAAARVLPPAGIKTIYNGQEIQFRRPLATLTATLPTELAGADGTIRRTQRQTQVEIHAVAAGECASIFEMGIPIVETGDRWHVNVLQKVPLAFERDNVTAGYLGSIRAIVLSAMAAELSTREDAGAHWVRDAFHSHGDALPAAAVNHVLTLRFGPQRVAFDPSDPEANKLATAAGFTVVSGGALSASEWTAAKRTGSILPAGQVTPSPRPFHSDGTPLQILAEDKWTASIEAVVEYSKRLALHLLGVEPSVIVADDAGWNCLAAYGGRGAEAGQLYLNAGRLGRSWFEGPLDAINDLLLHEFGHHYCGDHLSRDYSDALTKLGAKMVGLALQSPDLFELGRPAIVSRPGSDRQRGLRP